MSGTILIDGDERMIPPPDGDNADMNAINIHVLSTEDMKNPEKLLNGYAFPVFIPED